MGNLENTMTLHNAILRLQAIEKQKPNADFDFVCYPNGYGYEVKYICWNDERQMVEIQSTDQEEDCCIIDPATGQLKG